MGLKHALNNLKILYIIDYQIYKYYPVDFIMKCIE